MEGRRGWELRGQHMARAKITKHSSGGHTSLMPPVECTSLASGAEAPQYLALSPLVEDYPFNYPYGMEYQQMPMLIRNEVFLSSAALPDTPNPLCIMNYDPADSFGFNFDQHYQTSNDNFHQNIESETSSIFKSSCDILEGKDATMAMQSTANCKEIPEGALEIDMLPEYDNKKIESMNMWSRKDLVDWFCRYGASRESMELLHFNNFSHLHEILQEDMEGYAKRLGMAACSLRSLCNSFYNTENHQNTTYMPPPPLYPNGSHELLHEVKQESNSQMSDYHSWGQETSFHAKEEFTSEEEDQEEYEPEKPQVQVQRRTGKRGRPPSILSKAAAKRKEKGHGKLWEFIRDLLKEPKYCPSLICWENHDEGVFRFVSSEKVAKLWGDKRKNSNMTYEKLSRAMRYYYKSKILQPVTHRRLVYKFGPNAVNWRCENPNFARLS